MTFMLILIAVLSLLLIGAAYRDHLQHKKAIRDWRKQVMAKTLEKRD